MKTTGPERAVISIVKVNRSLSARQIIKRWRIGRLSFAFSWRSKHSPSGRFGGGWNWKLGLQLGGSTLILSLLTFELTARINRDKARAAHLDSRKPPEFVPGLLKKKRKEGSDESDDPRNVEGRRT